MCVYLQHTTHSWHVWTSVKVSVLVFAAGKSCVRCLSSRVPNGSLWTLYCAWCAGQKFLKERPIVQANLVSYTKGQWVRKRSSQTPENHQWTGMMFVFVLVLVLVFCIFFLKGPHYPGGCCSRAQNDPYSLQGNNTSFNPSGGYCSWAQNDPYSLQGNNTSFNPSGGYLLTLKANGVILSINLDSDSTCFFICEEDHLNLWAGSSTEANPPALQQLLIPSLALFPNEMYCFFRPLNFFLKFPYKSNKYGEDAVTK